MNPWEWDPKGCHWYNRDTGETLTPQQVWDMLADVRQRLEAAEEQLHVAHAAGFGEGFAAALAGKPGHICGDPNSDCDVSCMDRAALAGEDIKK